MQQSKEWSGGWGMWWLAPLMLWLGVVIAVGAMVVEWIAISTGGSAVEIQIFQHAALVLVLVGIAFILGGVGLYVRCSSCCDDCDWDESPTNTTGPA